MTRLSPFKQFLCQGKCLCSPHDWLSFEIKVVSECASNSIMSLSTNKWGVSSVNVQPQLHHADSKYWSRKTTMFLKMSVIFLICLVSLLQVVDSLSTQKQNYLDLKATSCSININTGPIKKLEDVILGMKRQLDEIQKDLRNLTKKEQNNTKRKCLLSQLLYQLPFPAQRDEKGTRIIWPCEGYKETVV